MSIQTQNEEYLLHDEQGTAALANSFAAELRGGAIIGLTGQLGAGKTTFVRYLLHVLDPQLQVTSPSFVIEHEHMLPNGLRIEHWDLYRLAELPNELLEPPDANTVRLIEWSDRFPELQPEIDISIAFEYGAVEHERKAIVTVRSV